VKIFDCAALRRADPPSKESYRLCIGLRNRKYVLDPKGCRAIERARERERGGGVWKQYYVSLIVLFVTDQREDAYRTPGGLGPPQAEVFLNRYRILSPVTLRPPEPGADVFNLR
jgi:hypothetical protein